MKNYLLDENIILRVCIYFFSFLEFYDSFIVALERRFDGPVIITSTQGGGNIEEIAAEHPEAMIHHPIDIITGLERPDALAIAGKLGFHNEALQEVCQFLFSNDNVIFNFLGS